MCASDKPRRNINAKMEHLEGEIIETGMSQVVQCINNGKYTFTLQYENTKPEDDEEINNDIKSIMLSLILNTLEKESK
ncbi:MAG: hypothetical protein J6C07_11700 [Lachnospiraceae bacterium]|nr:hypothetical protein [Lachnospiraceae bacterium]